MTFQQQIKKPSAAKSETLRLHITAAGKVIYVPVTVTVSLSHRGSKLDIRR